MLQVISYADPQGTLYQRVVLPALLGQALDEIAQRHRILSTQSIGVGWVTVRYVPMGGGAAREMRLEADTVKATIDQFQIHGMKIIDIRPCFE